ncbi:ig-like domain-containing protein [Caerostris extrusa]|uniref:Ig-like domain-containing protein n=1 Tax=Caerostris extrusa TaxID=172846 RepID=A0AAV4T5N1_CAEEX|nr:ig-like domain-containing protein [Caerostris extrusa]
MLLEILSLITLRRDDAECMNWFHISNVKIMIRVKYEIRTYDDFVVKGNTAVLKCYVPSSVQDFVPVISWETDEGFTIQRSSSDTNLWGTFRNNLEEYRREQAVKRLVFSSTKEKYSVRQAHLGTSL